MSWEIGVSGLGDWINDLRGANEFLASGVEDKMHEVGTKIVETARDKVRVDTGRLKSSIGFRVHNERGHITMEAGPGLGDRSAGDPPYSGVIEARYPYMGPSFKRHLNSRSRVLKDIARIAERAFED